MSTLVDIDRDEFSAQILRRAASSLGAGAALRLDSSAELFQDLRHDLGIRYQYLAETLAMGCLAIFEDHVAWQKIVYRARGVEDAILREQLEAQAEELRESAPDVVAQNGCRVIEHVLDRLDSMEVETASYLEGELPHRDLARRIVLAILEGRSRAALGLVRKALDDGLDFLEAHEYVVGPVQAELGRMWQLGEADIADEHFGTQLIEQVLHLLDDRRPEVPITGPKVLIAGVGGDLHDIGLRVLAQTFEASGWDVLLLGANTPAADMARAAKNHGVALVAVAASDALNLPHLIQTLDHLRAELDGTPVLVGGRVFRLSSDMWRAVGADAGAQDARHAVRVAEQLTKAS